MKLGINGRFYGAQRTGVQRFAVEVAARLLPDATLFLPRTVDPPDDLPATTRVVRGRLSGHLWEQLELPVRMAFSGCDILLHMAGTAPLADGGHVLVIHDVLPLTEPAWFSRGFRIWRKAVLLRAAPRASRIITDSEWARREIARTLRVSLSRILVAPQGIEPFNGRASSEAVAAVRARYELAGPFLLAVGADPRKNLSFLADVLRLWRGRGSEPPPLVIVGDPLAHLFSASSGWPPDLDVRRLGYLPDSELHALYTAASALCFPSRAEGFGRPPLEALACGTAAVVADYGAAAEVLGDAAHILPLDADAWVDALMQILAGTSPAGAGAGITSRYRWDDAADVVRSACERAAAERRAGVGVRVGVGIGVGRQ